MCVEGSGPVAKANLGPMTRALDPETRIARREGLIAEPLDDGIVMLDPEADRYLRLNSTGRLIWEALEEPATIGELARSLGERTGVELERAEADTSAFVAALIERGAVRPADA